MSVVYACVDANGISSRADSYDELHAEESAETLTRKRGIDYQLSTSLGLFVIDDKRALLLSSFSTELWVSEKTEALK